MKSVASDDIRFFNISSSILRRFLFLEYSLMEKFITKCSPMLSEREWARRINGLRCRKMRFHIPAATREKRLFCCFIFHVTGFETISEVNLTRSNDDLFYSYTVLALFYITSDGEERHDMKIKRALAEQKDELLLWQIFHLRQFNFVA